MKNFILTKNEFLSPLCENTDKTDLKFGELKHLSNQRKK